MDETFSSRAHVSTSARLENEKEGGIGTTINRN